MAISRDFSTYPSGFPTRELSLQVPFTELPQKERDTTPPELLSNLSQIHGR